MDEKKYISFSILAIIFAFLFFPLGIIFGIIALIQIKKTGEHGKGLAIASIIIGALIPVIMVVIGIVWVVVRNVTVLGGGDLDIHTKCDNVDVTATKVTCVNGTTNKICDVTFTRTGTETDAIGGVKLLFKNSIIGIISLIDVPGNILPQTEKKITGQDSGLANAEGVDTLDVVVYFKDASENEQLCAQINTKYF